MDQMQKEVPPGEKPQTTVFGHDDAAQKVAQELADFLKKQQQALKQERKKSGCGCW